MRYSTNIPKICLGTAAMGLDYGTFVKNKKPSKKQSYQILTTAWKNGINCIDTAHNYGSAEKIIGGWSKKKKKKPIIITKLPSLNKISNSLIEEKIEEKFSESCARLNVDSVFGYLIHDFQDIRNPRVLKKLISLKEEKKIRHLGISVYEPDQIKEIININELDIYQTPYSIVDQRVKESGILDLCRRKNKIVLARSVFLQGILLLNKKNLPKRFYPLKNTLKKLESLSKDLGCTPSQLILHFVLSEPLISSVIIGIGKEEELVKNLEIKNINFDKNIIKEIYKPKTRLPKSIIDPRAW